MENKKETKTNIIEENNSNKEDQIIEIENKEHIKKNSTKKLIKNTVLFTLLIILTYFIHFSIKLNLFNTLITKLIRYN